MAAFDLQQFLSGPSVEGLKVCRKEDLFSIATHLELTLPKVMKKAELLSTVIQALVAKGLISVSSTSGVSPTSGTVEREEGKAELKSDTETVTAPLSPTLSTGSGGGTGARYRLRLARMQMDAKEKERKDEISLKLELRKLELESQLEIRKLELESAERRGTVAAPSGGSGGTEVRDYKQYLGFVPPFNENDVDAYFAAFERMALSMRCPREAWAILLQCKLTGKAQEALKALSLEDSCSYDVVKASVLRAYELIPEAYRQRYRACRKAANSTFMDFAREKEVLFDRWCAASQVSDMTSLRQLILLEDFKNCLADDNLVTYLNDQRAVTLSAAAVLADEFMLSRKPFQVLAGGAPAGARTPAKQVTENKQIGDTPRGSVSAVKPLSTVTKGRACFYCHDSSHYVKDCALLKAKQQQSGASPLVPKGVGLIRAMDKPVQEPFSGRPNPCDAEATDPGYEQFALTGEVSLSGSASGGVGVVKILRDTGALQSVIRSDVLPFSGESFTGSNVLLQGIEMGYVLAPLHEVHLKCGVISGTFRVAVQAALPARGFTFILGNDIAGGRVLPPVAEVLDRPEIQSDDVAEPFPTVFPACVVTRSQAQKLGNVVTLSDTVLSGETPSPDPVNSHAASYGLGVDSVGLDVSRDKLVAAQKTDSSLVKCFAAVAESGAVGDARKGSAEYVLEDGLLMRKWVAHPDTEDGWGVVRQIVVPLDFRQQVLSLAHENVWSGHLGITKTHDRVLRHFFWPGLKRDVSAYCRTCHTCQVTGKPNQVIPPAPLRPIPVMGEPFEHVLVDCVGPLPKSKSGNEYLLTLMCLATRYPEAVPLRRITAQSVIKAMTKFFSTFGFPRILQTDRGSNFLSNVFEQVLRALSIEHRVSSAYHPESQGALERWHQTLKSVLRKYCLETGRDWDEGVPFALFAVREIVQESLGFSPAELVMGHTVRGPLHVLKDQLSSGSTVAPAESVLQYVARFRERLHSACAMAKEALSSTQESMKLHFDKRSVARELQPGDQVLVLMPMQGSSLSSRFSGPYEIERKLSETDYVIRTPDRRRKTRVCHVNMLKLYHSRIQGGDNAVGGVKSMATLVVSPGSEDGQVCQDDDEDGLDLRVPQQMPRLLNSELLQSLHSHLSYLEDSKQIDVIDLVTEFTCLFSDVPSRTTAIEHDIDVGSARPIKQHPYRVNAVKRDVMKKEVDYLVDNGLATASASPWSSPCILIPKPDGTFRFCTDYRRVNSVTVPDSYPLPRMDDCVDTIGSAQYVTKLDLLKGFWQVSLSARACEISAFVTPDSFQQYTVMAFGMRNAPATFQRLVNCVLAGVPSCTAYLDDLVVYSKQWGEHMATLKQVFQRLAGASLTLNLAKCEFGRATVTYLGRQVGRGVVRPVEAKVAAITDFPSPVTRRELQRFLGVAGYYRAFCKNFSAVVAPLTSLVSPLVPFMWSTDCQRAFECAKALLSNAPVLAAPDFGKPFKVEVDASDVGAGAVLMQEDESGLDHPVCYFSRKFNACQSRYATIEQETLALLMALEFFEVYVGSSVAPVVIYTDHNPLVFLARMYNKNRRLMRWALILQGYNIEIRHKKGSENVCADALSRV